MLIQLHFMSVQYVSIVLQRIDLCERAMLFFHEGHMYFACGLRLLSMLPAIVRSDRRAHGAANLRPKLPQRVGG